MNQSDIPVLDWFSLYGEGWREEITPEAYSHPAKFARGLIRRIYQHAIDEGYLKPGDHCIDPFGGVALGALDAMRYGLHWAGCELEPRFVALGNENIALWNTRYGPHLPNWGTARLLQGDSRQLAQVLAQAGVVGGLVSSPPFQQSNLTTDRDFMAKVERDLRNGSRLQPDIGSYGDSPGQLGVMPEGRPQAILSSPPFSPPGNNPTGQGQGVRADYREGKRTAATPETEYGTTVGQLGAMPMTGLDAIVSSPPYIDSVNSKGNGIDLSKTKRDGDISHQSLGHLTDPVSYGSSPGQLGSMPEGSPQAIISSPPFVGVEPTRDDAFRYTDGRPLGSTGDHYGTATGQLGVMAEGDVHGIVSSPPYAAGTVHSGSGLKNHRDNKKGVDDYGETDGQLGNMPSGIISSPPYEGSAAGNQGANQRRAQDRDVPFADLPGDRYGDSEGQLGGEVAETFWAAALVIVQQCYQVLAPGGYAIWVCKDFVRNKQRVPFSDQWLALCRHVGFVPVERIRAWVIEEAEAGQADIFGQVHTKRTERKSFFRRLAEKKGSPRIDWEDVIIVRKPSLGE